MKRLQQCPPVAKPKKSTPSNLKRIEPLPVTTRDTDPNERIVAIFTGLTVEVCDPVGIERLALGGCFGQGTLSRSFPKSVREGGGRVKKGEELILRRRQLERREEWRQKFGGRAGVSEKKVRVLDEDVEEQLESGAINQRQLKYALVEKRVDPFPVPEYLSLTFEESLFLAKELKCLSVQTLDGTELSDQQLLEKFSNLSGNFLSSYVGYVYLRSKNWVVKSGLKFGGDFILYQKGPQFFHASYIVLIQPYRKGAQLSQGAHYLENFDFQGFNRIAETTAKDLLILEVHFPEDLEFNDFLAGFDRLNEFRVSEIFPKHHNYLANRMSHQAGGSSK